MIGGIAAAVAAGPGHRPAPIAGVSTPAATTRAIHSPGTVSRRRHHPNRGNHPNPAKRRGARRHRVIRTFLSFSWNWKSPDNGRGTRPRPQHQTIRPAGHRRRDSYPNWRIGRAAGAARTLPGDSAIHPQARGQKQGQVRARWSTPAATHARSDPEYRRSQISGRPHPALHDDHSVTPNECRLP